MDPYLPTAVGALFADCMMEYSDHITKLIAPIRGAQRAAAQQANTKLYQLSHHGKQPPVAEDTTTATAETTTTTTTTTTVTSPSPSSATLSSSNIMDEDEPDPDDGDDKPTIAPKQAYRYSQSRPTNTKTSSSVPLNTRMHEAAEIALAAPTPSALRNVPAAEQLVGKVKSKRVTLTKEEQLEAIMEKLGCRAPPDDRKLAVIEDIHRQGHFGEKHIFLTLWYRVPKVWWKNIRADIRKVLHNCQACIQYTIRKEGFHPARTRNMHRPGDVVAMDVGTLPAAPGGEEHFLVIIELFTGFVFLHVLKDTNAPTLARKIMKTICLFGPPLEIVLDSAGPHCSSIMVALSYLTGSELHFVTTYYPQANGKAENAVKTIKQMIVKSLAGYESRWPLYLSQIQFYANMKIKERTGSTPFALMFGRVPNITSEYMTKGMELDVNSEEWRRHQEQIISLIYPSIELRARQYSQDTIDYLNKIRAPLIIDNLPPGTVVMVRDPETVNKNASQRTLLKAPFLPLRYTVVKRERDGAYLLRDELGAIYPRLVPVNHLKALSTRRGVEEDTGRFIVDDIIDRRREANGEMKYRIRWKGWTHKGDTWETADKIMDKQMLRKFNADYDAEDKTLWRREQRLKRYYQQAEQEAE